jgi:putative MATE family efflux protein
VTRTTERSTTKSTAITRAWGAVRTAAGGTTHDYTQGAIGHAIFLLAVPMVLEMVMESLFAVSDVFFVSKLGAAAVATVGLTESLMIIVYTLAMGLAIAASAIVSRRIGEHDPEQAAVATVQAIAVALAISGAMAAVSAAFAPELLRFMGADADVIATGTTFTRVMLGGSCTAFVLFVINATLRGAGDAAVAMRVLTLANGINIVLGPLLIFGVGPLPKLGVAGAAVATTFGRGVGVLFALSRLLRGTGHLAVKRRHLTLDLPTIGRLLRMSRNGTFQVLVGSLNWIVLVRLMSAFGSVAMAGYTIAIRLVIFALLPAWGLSNAAATMVGQALGAANPDRAEASVWVAARYNVIFLGAMAVLLFVGAPVIISAFTSDPAVSDVATFGLRTIALGFPAFAFGMVLTQSFNGAGDTVTPTWINIGVFWLFETPIAWLLSTHSPLQWRAIFGSVLAAYTALAIVSALLFRRGRWRTKTV